MKFHSIVVVIVFSCSSAPTFCAGLGTQSPVPGVIEWVLIHTAAAAVFPSESIEEATDTLRKTQKLARTAGQKQLKKKIKNDKRRRGNNKPRFRDVKQPRGKNHR